MTAVPVEQLADPVWALLAAVAHINAFDGDFVDTNGDPVDMKTSPYVDPDGRVHAYAVYYPGPGRAHALLTCGGTDSIDWSFQVTCAGGDRTRALWCVTQVRNALTGKTITIGGQKLQIQEVTNPGSIRRDDAVSPARFYTPIIFAINA